MTIICIKDGIMAADTGYVIDDIVASTKASKLTKIMKGVEEGGIFGACGFTQECQEAAKWAKDGLEGQIPETFQDFEEDFLGVFLLPSLGPDKIMRIEGKGKTSIIPIDFHAIGGCDDFAYGALAAGKSAVETVHLCIKHTRMAYGDVHWMKLICH